MTFVEFMHIRMLAMFDVFKTKRENTCLGKESRNAIKTETNLVIKTIQQFETKKLALVLYSL